MRVLAELSQLVRPLSGNRLLQVFLRQRKGLLLTRGGEGEEKFFELPGDYIVVSPLASPGEVCGMQYRLSLASFTRYAQQVAAEVPSTSSQCGPAAI